MWAQLIEYMPLLLELFPNLSQILNNHNAYQSSLVRLLLIILLLVEFNQEDLLESLVHLMRIYRNHSFILLLFFISPLNIFILYLNIYFNFVGFWGFGDYHTRKRLD